MLSPMGIGTKNRLICRKIDKPGKMEKFLGDLRAWLQSEENFLELRLLVTDERDNMVRLGSSAEHSQVPSISISVPASYPDMRDGDEVFSFFLSPSLPLCFSPSLSFMFPGSLSFVLFMWSSPILG